MKRVSESDELDWYKFFNVDHGIEYHWGKIYNDMCEPVADQCIVFMGLYDIMDFNETIGRLYANGYLSDCGGVDCKWQDYTIAMDILPILEYYGLDPERIFPDKEA